MKKILLLLLIFVSGCTGVVAQQFDYGKIAPHPRLLLPEGGEESIKKAIHETQKQGIYSILDMMNVADFEEKLSASLCLAF